MGTGILVFPGNEESAMNYGDNTYPFRQDSTFLYFFGLDLPGLFAVIDLDENKEIIFGDDISVEDIVWMGYLPKIRDNAALAGVRKTAPRSELAGYLKKAAASRRKIHYLPQYRSKSILNLASLLGISAKKLNAGASLEFIKAVIDMRMVKQREEIKEIEAALDITSQMYSLAMAVAKPGCFEYEIAGAMEGVALCSGVQPAFPLIVTIEGQILHKHSYNNQLVKGSLLVADTGAESALHYASDITRTIPVSGKFSRKQRDIYEIVLAAEETAIRSVKPGVMFKEIHLKAARVIASGLKNLGLMKGDVDQAVAVGAHALFFPHGLGHNMGLDVHDMENLGEKYIGYDESVERSRQFGLAYLRMARTLKPGYVMTIEPGIYFIPALFEQWKQENKFRDFIVYDKVEKYLGFGGIRIEDDVLVTEKGRKVLGRPIPKTVEDVEAACRIK